MRSAPVYSSAQELDGTTWIPCGNRRAAVCAPCSATYKRRRLGADHRRARGGKGIPESVADHPCTFATLTAPSFGPVHGIRQKGPCRARRDKPVCPHGRPLWCTQRHRDDDPRLGEPLCVGLLRLHRPRGLAVVRPRAVAPVHHRPATRPCPALRPVGRRRSGSGCKIAYSKVVEFQARGVIHVHVPIRLDGPEGPDGAAPDLPLTTDGSRGRHPAPRPARSRLDAAPLADGRVYRLRWGSQVDTRTITDTADRDSHRSARWCTRSRSPPTWRST